MEKFSPQRLAGETLRYLIKKQFATQQDFADEYGTDIRTTSRYINEGINKVDVIQELAEFFDVDISFFFVAHS